MGFAAALPVGLGIYGLVNKLTEVPKVQPILSPPPLPETSEAKEAGVEERRKALARKGFKSNIKTSPMGLLGEATVAKKGLLGE